MATLEDLKIQIEDANALGRTNLFENGVELPETATTYNVMESIGDITSLYASLNVSYGETAPEDTSKLWIKAAKPANISIDNDLNIIDKIIISNTRLSIPTSDMGCASIGTKVYLFGGYNSGHLNTINVFDTATETISTLPTTLPTACYGMGCASVGTKIYLLGGYGGNDGHDDNLNEISVFNTETESITKLSATLPTACYDMGCAAVGTKIYLFGGYVSGPGGGTLNTINVFDTTTETISTLSATLPTACYGMGCASVGTKIYLLGGYGGNDNYLNTINIFDTATETISTLPTTLPTACYNIACAAVGTKIYLLGGYDGGDGYDHHSGYLNTINIFDTETEIITTSPTKSPKERTNIACTAVGTKIYLFGGYSFGQLDEICIFYKAHELKQGNIKIQSGSLTNKFNLINTKNTQIRIGVENVYIGNEIDEAELCEAYLHNGTDWVVI